METIKRLTVEHFENITYKQIKNPFFFHIDDIDSLIIYGILNSMLYERHKYIEFVNKNEYKGMLEKFNISHITNYVMNAETDDKAINALEDILILNSIFDVRLSESELPFNNDIEFLKHEPIERPRYELNSLLLFEIGCRKECVDFRDEEERKTNLQEELDSIFKQSESEFGFRMLSLDKDNPGATNVDIVTRSRIHNSSISSSGIYSYVYTRSLDVRLNYEKFYIKDLFNKKKDDIRKEVIELYPIYLARHPLIDDLVKLKLHEYYVKLMSKYIDSYDRVNENETNKKATV